MPRTKIVCTIGPSSRNLRALEGLITAGMDVARLNFSHGTHQEHAAALAAVRRIAAACDRPVAILQDLAGVKIRIGDIAAGSVLLETGSEVILTSRPVPGDAREISVTYPDLPKSVAPGDTLILADGDIELKVVDIQGSNIRCRVVVGGTLTAHKGINLPSRSLPAPGLTSKDRDDLDFGLAQGVEYVALSFVRSADNVFEARRFLEDRGRQVPLIAKIEKHEALEEIDAIIDAVDGIMVARGDLGIETPLEHVPFLQKMLIEKSNRAGKPVITATQMLRSMVENPRPTRAEVADVANAILDGTDAVMLSEETASGRYPIEAARMMARIATDAERQAPFDVWHRRVESDRVQSLPDAVADAACRLAEDVRAACVIACTESGATARLVARHRPRQPIVAPTPLEETYRRLALVWGVVPLRMPDRPPDGIESAVRLARDSGLVRSGDSVVVIAGVPMGVPGGTNSIRAIVVP